MFIKFTHSFVAIEFFTFCKNAKKKNIAQENSRYSIRKQDSFLFLFVYIKMFPKKKGFCIWMKIKMTAIIERQRACFYIQKNQKKIRTFLCTKSQTLFKKLDNSRYVVYTNSHTVRMKNWPYFQGYCISTTILIAILLIF